MRGMAVFDALSDILLLALRIRERKLRLIRTITGYIRKTVVLIHTAFTGSSGINPTVVIITGKNIFHFICITGRANAGRFPGNWEPYGRYTTITVIRTGTTSS